jgi:hypothetical protein
MGNSPHTISTHTLDDDSLLNIFYLYRPGIFDEDEDVGTRILGGKGWERERWWYKLAQVCQRWRNLILESASYLGLCLVCTYGTPVADMLAHSPHLPLVIDYSDADCDIAAEDEEGANLALEQHNRIRRIRLQMPVLKLQKLITTAICEEYPMLDYLIMMPSMKETSTALVLPETLQAPHLRHLALTGFVHPTGSRLLTTAMGIVTLCLYMSHPSAYFQPDTLLQWISLMPQLETLLVAFFFPVPDRYVGRQLMRMPIMTHVTLPNLRWFAFQGVSTYMEAVTCRITTPRLEKFGVQFFLLPTYSVPRLLQFVNTTESLRFDSAEFKFSEERVYVYVYPRDAKPRDAISIFVDCWHLDWQVSSVAQIFNSPSQIFSRVEHLILEHELHSRSSEEHNEVDRTEWRKLLRPFSKVKTLRVDDGLIEELARSLRLDDGEHPLELLPELQELAYIGSGDAGEAFTPFIDARQNAGHAVTLVRLVRVTPLS